MKSDLSPSRHAIAIWLFTCCAMIFLMALLGAITRLTESGLSITDWQPIGGALPPLSDTEWNKAFLAYQQIPQYKLLHHGMMIQEFKGIYFWEWLHRLWGRVISFAFALPFLYFLFSRKISKALGYRLLGIFLLGALQGLIGWLMVKSGLSDRTSVSAYQLVLHFADAVLIYALIFWTALTVLDPHNNVKPVTSKHLIHYGWILVCLLSMTMFWGVLTAGLHAGESYTTWPLMDGEFFPSAATTLIPMWVNLFENLALVQFLHRWLGPTTACVIGWWVLKLFSHAQNQTDQRWALALGAAALTQVALGLTTLLSHANIIAATLHQAGALTLFTCVLVNIHRLSYSRYPTAPETGVSAMRG